MAKQTAATLCPDDRLSAVIAAIQDDATDGIAEVKPLVREFSGDPRLRFLLGSLLASARRYPEAKSEMREALRLAPDYAIARFQLGLLELSSGDAAAAETTWRRLDDLPSDDALRVLSSGLRSLARDEFPEAIQQLERGMALNLAYPQVNSDMQLVIDAIRNPPPQAPDSDDGMSAAQMLLRQHSGKATRH